MEYLENLSRIELLLWGINLQLLFFCAFLSYRLR